MVLIDVHANHSCWNLQPLVLLYHLSAYLSILCSHLTVCQPINPSTSHSINMSPPFDTSLQLVERALAEVCAAHNTGAGSGSGGDKTVGVVRLSGLLHCEERTAFQEVARQLCG